jgi:hypothetical protein
LVVDHFAWILEDVLLVVGTGTTFACFQKAGTQPWRMEELMAHTGSAISGAISLSSQLGMESGPGDILTSILDSLNETSNV